MNADKDISKSVVTVPFGVGNAVGIPGRTWYVAMMNRNNVEKATAERLTKQGYECYVATQQVMRQWKNGRRKKVDHVVIPSMVFVYCNEKERLEVAYDPNISRFLTDRALYATNSRTSKIVTIPAIQIARLKFMLGQSDIPVEFTKELYNTGDKVRIIRGNLMGLEGRVIQVSDGKSELVVSVNLLGSAKLSVSTIDLERLA